MLRSAPARSRLCLVLAMTTLFLTATGVEVVKTGQRRLVDPHWFRGSSYLKLVRLFQMRLIPLNTF